MRQSNKEYGRDLFLQRKALSLSLSLSQNQFRGLCLLRHSRGDVWLTKLQGKLSVSGRQPPDTHLETVSLSVR